MQPTNKIRHSSWLTPANTRFLLAAAYTMTVAILLSTVIVVLAGLMVSAQTAARVQITPNEGARRVDIMVDGKPFTSYIWPTTLKKPTLFPLRSAKGSLLTRGFPLEPRPGEPVDHPHHVGLWFNHGDVNGLDFWNNSDDIKGERVQKMGTIVHKKIGDIYNGANRGELNVEMEWHGPDGKALLRENTKFVFSGTADTRTIDRITTLTALDSRVTFRDNKEGSLGMRVARQLEHPATQPQVYTDSSGKATTVKVLDNKGVTGMYTSSEGLKGDAVWGTRGRWVMLAGTIASDNVTVAMLDHPSNPTHPTYWHARGYGLFSANVFGRQVFDPKQEELVITLDPGKSLTFRHRIHIASGNVTPDTIEREYRTFTSGQTSTR